MATHMNFCKKFKASGPPPDPTVHLISAMRQILRRSLDSPRVLRSTPTSPTKINGKGLKSHQSVVLRVVSDAKQRDERLKRSKLQDGERKGEHDRDRDRNRDRDSYHACDRDRYHDREREHGWDHGRDRDRDYDRDWDWDRDYASASLLLRASSDAIRRATTSFDFVLQWGNRKRLRCMKIQVKDKGRDDSDAPVTRTTVRVDRRVRGSCRLGVVVLMVVAFPVAAGGPRLDWLGRVGGSVTEAELLGALLNFAADLRLCRSASLWSCSVSTSLVGW
ncbi:hypothetical protein L3X38_041862 [Prunus dulcis]|uniref:Uncharacterized protein n=1 Tax=Prunus dulcis TaxID=3755 RepID=A0AAD4UUU0_PRUDU|nr:hypothetical protein L3X38_041862 [Prunus dulcis]